MYKIIHRVGQNNQQIGHIVRLSYVLSNLLDMLSNLLDYLPNMYSSSQTKETKYSQYLINRVSLNFICPIKYDLLGPPGSRGSYILKLCVLLLLIWFAAGNGYIQQPTCAAKDVLTIYLLLILQIFASLQQSPVMLASWWQIAKC